jgi:hypothetical protein
MFATAFQTCFDAAFAASQAARCFGLRHALPITQQERRAIAFGQSFDFFLKGE